MLTRVHEDERLNTLAHYLSLVNATDKASAVIDAVNYYGHDTRTWPRDIATAIRKVSTNCYWRGMFHETGMKCFRCDRDCQHRK